MRTFGLEGGSPGVPLIAYTPYFGLFGLMVLVGALALRRWAAATLALLAVIVLGAAVIPRAVPTASSATVGGSELTVMSANLRLGEASPEAVVALVEGDRVDALSVQELTPGAVEGLRAAGLEQALPHRVLSVGQDSSGSGLYSRYPLRRLNTVSVGTGPVAQPQARVRLPGGDQVDLVAVHPAPPTRPAQITRWREGLRSLPLADQDATPRILIGDFNATLDHAELRRLLDSGFIDAADATGKGLVATWRSTRFFLPPLTIDHVLVDPRIAVHAVDVSDLVDSDHRAVTAELSLGGALRPSAEPQTYLSSGPPQTD